MVQEKVYVTKQGLEELKQERERLIRVEREEVKLDLQNARAQGDLSENADYDAARDRQAKVEARISELEQMLSNYEIINENGKASKSVKLGSTIRILDLEDNLEEEYTIVGSVEADPLNGKLSNVTPLGAALLDCRQGEIVTIEAAEPYQVQILEIK